MSASVCLRILLDLSDEKLAKLDALGPLVTRVTSAFLETCWSWPDRYSIITPFSFLLTEPSATVVNVARMERLASELQVKLFGKSNAGDVILLLLDGDELNTARFVQLDHASLKRATQDPMGPTPFGGRLMKISTAADAPPGLNWQTLELDPRVEAPAPVRSVPADGPLTVFNGVYAAGRQRFVGCAIACTPAGADTPYSLVDGLELLPTEQAAAFDLACVDAAARTLAREPLDGLLFLPVSFSSLMRRSTREVYAAGFKRLPPDRRPQLAAAIYDVPRSLVFNAVTQLHGALSRFFAHLDLQITDPAFEVDQIPSGVIDSATFRLPDGDERARLSAMRRFMERREHFERRRIRLGLTNLRGRTELQAAVRLSAPFVSGAAVCGAMSEPIGAVPCEALRLPLKRTAAAPTATTPAEAAGEHWI